MDKSNKKLKITCGVLSGAVLLSIFGFMFYAWYFGLGRNTKFKTNLTEDEIIAKITKRTEEKFAEALSNGLMTFTVELVYNFNENKPEYFLVEIDIPEGFTLSGDEYVFEKAGTMRIFGLNGGRYGLSLFNGGGFWPDKNYYEEKGYEGLRKYYGNRVSAVKKGRKMINLRTDKVIPWYRYEYMSRNGYRLPYIKY
jgi:hypothetical protein